MSTWAGRPRLTFTRRYATETNRGNVVRGLKPIVGEPTIRGLKPTAKFRCRYAAEMRLQPTTNGPRPRVSVPRPMGFRSTAHGFPFHGVGIPKSTSLCAGNHDTAGLKSSRVASATVEVSPAFQRRGTGFNPRITDAPMPPRRVATIEFSRGFQPTDRGFTHDGFQPTDRTHPQRPRHVSDG